MDSASCSDGSVYAFITEIPSKESAVSVSDIAVTPAVIELAAGETKPLTIIGIKGGLYSNVEIDPADCTITPEDEAVATAENGTVTAVAAGTTYINVEYGEAADMVRVIVA